MRTPDTDSNVHTIPLGSPFNTIQSQEDLARWFDDLGRILAAVAKATGLNSATGISPERLGHLMAQLASGLVMCRPVDPFPLMEAADNAGRPAVVPRPEEIIRLQGLLQSRYEMNMTSRQVAAMVLLLLEEGYMIAGGDFGNAVDQAGSLADGSPEQGPEEENPLNHN